MRTWTFLLLAGLATLGSACRRTGTPGITPPPAGVRMVDGTVTYRTRVALPAAARLEVWITRESGIGTAVVPGRIDEPLAGRQVPIAFRVPVDTSLVDPTADYVLRAVITADGRRLFETAEPVPVLGPAATSRLELVLVAARADDAAGDTLTGTRWRLESLAGAPVLPSAVPTMEFPEAGRVAGQASCNRFFGAVTHAGSSLTFGAMGSTRMACAEAVNRQESAFLAALAQVRKVERRGDVLLLTGDGLSAPLRFTRDR